MHTIFKSKYYLKSAYYVHTIFESEYSGYLSILSCEIHVWKLETRQTPACQTF